MAESSAQRMVPTTAEVEKMFVLRGEGPIADWLYKQRYEEFHLWLEGEVGMTRLAAAKTVLASRVKNTWLNNLEASINDALRLLNTVEPASQAVRQARTALYNAKNEYQKARRRFDAT